SGEARSRGEVIGWETLVISERWMVAEPVFLQRKLEAKSRWPSGHNKTLISKRLDFYFALEGA
ncbi:hypothetical protein J6590_101902, partial [Homalodisca vitripennis]